MTPCETLRTQHRQKTEYVYHGSGGGRPGLVIADEFHHRPVLHGVRDVLVVPVFVHLVQFLGQPVGDRMMVFVVVKLHLRFDIQFGTVRIYDQPKTFRAPGRRNATAGRNA